MASPKISIISERFNFQNIIQNNWLGEKTRASNKDPLSKSNCIFPFCPLSINFCYFPLNGVQELFPRHPLKSYLDSRASCEMWNVKCYHWNTSLLTKLLLYIATILLFSTTTSNLCNFQTFSAYSNLTLHFSLIKVLTRELKYMIKVQTTRRQKMNMHR